MKIVKKFRVGDRVRLSANEEEGWPEERGQVIGVSDQKQYPGMYIVTLDKKYVADAHDDGIREVHVDDIESAK